MKRTSERTNERTKERANEVVVRRSLVGRQFGSLAVWQFGVFWISFWISDFGYGYHRPRAVCCCWCCCCRCCRRRFACVQLVHQGLRQRARACHHSLQWVWVWVWAWVAGMSWRRHLGCWMLDAGCWMLDTGCEPRARVEHATVNCATLTYIFGQCTATLH